MVALILPYLFEPLRLSDNSDSWTDCSGEEEDEEDMVQQPHIQDRARNKVTSETWCKCTHCQQKKLAIECVCCKELEETRKMVEKEDIGTVSYTHLTLPTILLV